MAKCKKQWKIDVNDRYQNAVGVVASLSTASLVLPIIFLRDIAGVKDSQSIIDVISWLVYLSWIFLALSVFAAIIYYFCSAKWVKLAWGKDPDFFGKKILFGMNIDEKFIENLLDGSYLIMMIGFLLGLSFILIFIVNYTVQ